MGSPGLIYLKLTSAINSIAVPERKVLAALELPSWILPTPTPVAEPQAQQFIQDNLGANSGPNTQTLGQNETIPDRPYSPSDVYAETVGKAEEGRY